MRVWGFRVCRWCGGEALDEEVDDGLAPTLISGGSLKERSVQQGAARRAGE